MSKPVADNAVENVMPLTPGARVLWHHQPRGGYGYVIRVPATVCKVGRAKVGINAQLARGGEKHVWVLPEYLEVIS